MKDNKQYSSLLFEHLKKDGTDQMQEALAKWLSENPEHMHLFEELNNDELLAEAIKEYHPDQLRSLEERMLGAIKIKKQRYRQDVYVLQPKKKFFRIAVAACLIALLGIAVLYLNSFKDHPVQPSAETKLPDDIKAPETNRAILRLADGGIVYLDSVNNGQIAMQGNMKLVKLSSGRIRYEGVNTATDKTTNGDIKYNTLVNPRGSRVVDVILGDGSHVWLNTESSITYPVAFTTSDRHVSVTGEAYFEVAHDAMRPFVVTRGETKVEVLGTHFNVNAYEDEPSIKITLLEGSVNVSKQQTSRLLRPGQQAILGSTIQDIQVVRPTDPMANIAWKNGIFNFNDVELPTMVRQLARWYDLDLQMTGVIRPVKMSGELTMDLTLSQVLSILSDLGVHYEINGKKLIILP